MKRKTRKRSAVISEEIKRAAIKKLSNNNIHWRSKWKGFSAAFLFSSSSRFVRVYKQQFTLDFTMRRHFSHRLPLYWLLCEHWNKFDSGTTPGLNSCLCRASVEPIIDSARHVRSTTCQLGITLLCWHFSVIFVLLFPKIWCHLTPILPITVPSKMATRRLIDVEGTGLCKLRPNSIKLTVVTKAYHKNLH